MTREHHLLEWCLDLHLMMGKEIAAMAKSNERKERRKERQRNAKGLCAGLVLGFALMGQRSYGESKNDVIIPLAEVVSINSTVLYIGV